MVPLAVVCGCAMGTRTARTRISRIFGHAIKQEEYTDKPVYQY
jgi:hypothetical protein